MTTIQRLTDLLNDRDSKIEELEQKVQEFEDAQTREWKWCIHHESKKDLNDLPVPRLEIRAKTMSGNWCNFWWEYSLVYKHLLGQIVWVPLGKTTTESGRGLPPVHNGIVHGPFRDGAHIMNESEQLNLPAFYIVETDPPFIQKIERVKPEATA